MRRLGLLVACLAFWSSFAETKLSEIAMEAGISFQHVNGTQGEFWLAEIIGAGVAVADFDGDDWLDVWVVQSGNFDSTKRTRYDQVFRNLGLIDGLQFVDVTSDWRIHANEYGMGIATGDYDNDGDIDVFLANYGKNQLFENRLPEGFFEVTEKLNSNLANFSVAASFVDVNHDGWLDIYIANYVEFNLASHRVCFGISTRPDYCAPNVYASQADQLYLNDGRGGFQDISQKSGILSRSGGGLGVIALDANNDRSIDLYVANDPHENFLWLNNGHGVFTESAIEFAVAVNGDGESEASMGVDAMDFDEDCDLDLFMTNLTVETNTLYTNEAGRWFNDRTNRLGLGASSAPYTGFGTRWLDIENDGDLDLVAVNGAVSVVATGSQYANSSDALRQRNQLWLNDDGSFHEYVDHSQFFADEVSRGLAIGDLDNDGDSDLVVTNNNGQLQLFRNDFEQQNWIGIKLQDSKGSEIGATVAIDGKACSNRRVHTDGSYASAGDLRVVYGLGISERPINVRIVWRDESETIFENLLPNRYHILTKN